MNNYGIAIARDLAVFEAENKKQQGLLVDVNDETQMFEFGFCRNTPIGRKETVYTIMAAYSDHPNNDGTWVDIIYNVLNEKYPNYFLIKN